jgi:hypothetical protein
MEQEEVVELVEGGVRVVDGIQVVLVMVVMEQ